MPMLRCIEDRFQTLQDNSIGWSFSRAAVDCALRGWSSSPDFSYIRRNPVDWTVWHFFSECAVYRSGTGKDFKNYSPRFRHLSMASLV